ncbi:rhodanese-like domain-containing protein [Haloplanus sp. GCM10025708]|uniref:rhodanese-like domain-containing protein n=1 Tax=Haloferacaceae TaxID=1644056 RepID=UPI00361110CC
MTQLTASAWGMVEEAEADVPSVTVEELREELEAGTCTAVDIRDVRELWREGTIPGAKHVPRGMLEFWSDPDTEYYRDFMVPDRRYVLFCNEAGRSALAAKRLSEMGYEDVVHLEGGFTAWEESGGDVEDVSQRDYES